MSERGWIKIHRKLFDHWLWDNKKKSKFEAWIWMIQKANHSGKKIMLGNDLINIDRGEFITSELKMMDQFKWSKTKLRSFLKTLENDSMIVQKKDKKKTTIKLTNYCFHQDQETTKEPQKDHKRTTKEPQKDTNNNVKNDKNKNKPPNGFDSFWSSYPKKKSKGQAEKAFQKIKPDDTMLEKILYSISIQKESHDWLKESGKYIPYPATWLNAKGWEDEEPQQSNPMSV